MPLRCLFLVQGEGRGHLTQAMALRNLLLDAGHRVEGVVVGQSPSRAVPSFFETAFDAPVTFVESPSFVPDDHDRAVRPWLSLARELGRTPTFLQSVETIHSAVQRSGADVIVNFFEPLSGLYAGLHRPSTPIVAVGHQYMFHHPAYAFPPGRRVQRWGTCAFSDLTAWGADRRLALSLYPAPDRPEDDLVVLPPLLRPSVLGHSGAPDDSTEPFVLAYLLNSGYAEEVIHWHEQHPEVPLHCFWDAPDAAPVERYDDTLTFHQLDDDKFLSLLARSQGFVSTAGFESVAESLYLGTPVQVVPVEGHFEQQCNAHDATRAGAGIQSDRFDLDRLLAYLPQHTTDGADFRRWIHQTRTRFVRQLEAVAASGNESAPTATPSAHAPSLKTAVGPFE